MFVSEAPSSGGQGRTAALVAALALAAIFAAVSAGSAMAATPHVAINHPLQGGYTNNQAPTVSGTTDDLLDPVTLNLYAGANAIGSPVRTATTAFPLASEGWEVTLAPAVEPGEYTAVAEQGLSEVGKSEAVTFTVDTTPPEVSISPVPSPTGDSTPTLKGAAGTAPGDDKTVTVTIYQGSSVGGSIAASENVSAVGGTWSFASPLLADGTYTAQATQGDQAGNSGKSEPVTFVVDTSPPKVNLNQPPSPSKNTTPSFSGTATDSTQVTVEIYAGGTAQGSPVASATANPSGGEWGSGKASPALTEGTYTAQASQPSSLGNSPGKSEPVTFTVITASPTVTLSQPETPSNHTGPEFRGTASDSGTVTVHIYDALHVEVANATATPSGGKWTSDRASPALTEGSYTAQATEESSLGNAPGMSEEVSFTVITTPPTVTLKEPASPSNQTQPSFSGTATDSTEVTVEIYSGGTAQGSPVASATANPSGGEWSSGKASPALTEGTYTAQASEPSSLGNSPGKSEAVTFTVITASPTVTLSQPETPSNHTGPEFRGTASDSGTVTVHIYDALHVEVATATATPSGGKWTSDRASPALTEGSYTAQATEESSLGNAPGMSEEVSFTVITTPPTVTLKEPASPSNQTQPSFSGTATDSTQVTVEIYAGSKVGGSPVASATAKPSGGEWGSGKASPALTEGTYTAQASQPSSLGNSPGKSEAVTFTVITAAPTVTLSQPQSPSNHTKPAFTGTASDSTLVTVNIYAGNKVSGSPVSSATASPSGKIWGSGEASPALGEGTYTAQASQPSSLGNPPGKSEAVTFTVVTASPTVMLNQLQSPSGNTTPIFTGTASDTTPVTIKIYPGERAEGTAVSFAGATGTGGAWTSGHASPPLSSGTYTAIAIQPSSVENPEGVSSPVTFTVDTSSPTVTLDQPVSPSKNTQPAFTGTASASTIVTVHIYDSLQAEVAHLTANPSGGKWSSTKVTPPLQNGTYSAVATEASPLGNPPGTSSSVSFTVNTRPPVVTLNSPALRSNNTTPSFTGTASDTTPVTVDIYAGSRAEGTVVATATAATVGGGGQWSSAASSPALTGGTYTAVAIQESSLGNPDGESSPVTFVVDTSSPTVTLDQPKSPSKDTTPSFSGTASDSKPVIIHIYNALKVEVASATASANGGSWTSPLVTPALASGEHTYTAVAVQESSLGNPPGESAPVTFTVNTNPPAVTLAAPASPSNNATPAFTGTATDTTPVTVKIYAGLKTEGTVAATATATTIGSGGQWSSGAPSHALSDGEYTAIAVQQSSLENAAGVSAAVRFTVDSTPPAVHIARPPNGVNLESSRPTFSGSAGSAPGDLPSVSLKIYAGSSASGSPAQTLAVVPSNGMWTTGSTGPQLPNGTYTAVAEQSDSAGNTGTSTSTFKILTNSPAVTLNPSAFAKRGTKLFTSASPSFRGSAAIAPEDSKTVTLKIYSGTSTSGSPVRTLEATLTGSSWSAGPVPALSEGTYTVQAEQTSFDFYSQPGLSSSFTFTVDATPPPVAISSPPSGGSTSGESVVVEGSAGTDEGDVARVVVQLYSGSAITAGQEPAQIRSVIATMGSWSETFAGLHPGSYSLRAEQSDDVGNQGVSQTITFTVGQPTTAAAPVHPASAPAASFSWFPTNPHPGERVSLASSSTDATSPITSLAWDLTGKGGFLPGAQTVSTAFSTPGNHLVRLRVTDAGGLSSVAAGTIVVTPRPLITMQPFPIVRIAGSATRSGVNLRLLSVLAPPRARITVSCKGRRCPVKSQSRVAAVGRIGSTPIEFKRFERPLRAGVTLEIRVSRPGEVGKYTSFAIRRGKLPVRHDYCLDPTGVRPMRCPPS